MADELGIPFETVRNVNEPEFIDRIRRRAPDVNVSMSFNQILRRSILDSAGGGFINCHAGALPFYRGRNALNWALINGAEEIGVTVHYVDGGIDTGDIILQRFFAVGENDDYARVLDSAAELCATTLTEALSLIFDGTLTAVPQEGIHPVGMYCSRRRVGDEWIDWSWPSKRIHNFVRALAPPGPGARTFIGDEVIAITETRHIVGAPDYIDRPGTVVGRDGEGVTVKTGDSSIKVIQVGQAEGADTTREAVPKFRIGTFLGKNILEELLSLRQRVHELEQQLESS
jgi:methionyl-tRNA formyltransferase